MSLNNINEKGETPQRFESYKNHSGGTYPTGPSSNAPLSDYFPLVIRAPYRGETITVAHVYHYKAEEHAAFIVTACNSHYEMLTALKDAAEALQGQQETPARKERYARVLAAIAKAEGK